MKPKKSQNNNLPLPTCLQAEAEIQKVQLPQDTNHFGRSKTTNMPQQSTENDSPIQDSLKPISKVSQMTLFDLWAYQTVLSSAVLAQTFPWLEKEQVLREVADNCFLKQSDSWKSSSLRVLSLKTSMALLATTKGKPSRRSSLRLDNWGMWGLGNYLTETATCPKTDQEFSVWVITGDIRATKPKPYKRSLQECLDGTAINSFIVHKSAGGERYYYKEAPCLRSRSVVLVVSLSSTNGHQSGSGAIKVREFQSQESIERPLTATEAERLMRWLEGSTAIGFTAEGKGIEISTTQRLKMLGNGIIPAEITEILQGLKEVIRCNN